MNQAMEERFLFLLLLLRQPRLRMVYVTSMPINHARSSSTTCRCCRASSRAMPGRDSPSSPSATPSPRRSPTSCWPARGSSPRIASLVPDRARSHLVPYNSTTRERDLALLLGIPMYAADPRLFPLGTKTGCRRVFAEAGVAHPFGAEDLHSRRRRRRRRCSTCTRRGPASQWAMVKLNEGVSGSGNALVDLRGLPGAAAAPSERDGRLRGPRCGRCSWRTPASTSAPTWRSWTSAAASSRSGSSATRCAARACSCG